MRVVSAQGELLARVDAAGLQTYNAALSQDGRFLAAATFTSDVKVGLTYILLLAILPEFLLGCSTYALCLPELLLHQSTGFCKHAVPGKMLQ